MGILGDYQKWKKKVDRAIPAALLDDVKEVVEIDFLHTAETNVYEAYHPNYYGDGSGGFQRMRRYGGGGIYDIGLIKTRLEGNRTLVMKQTAPPNSDYPIKATAIDWVESGDGVPGIGRPFYAPLKARTTPRAQRALISGINKRI